MRLGSNSIHTFPSLRSLKPRFWIAAGLLSGLALYLAYASRFYAGYFGDDAAYLLTAQSLLRGSFRSIYLLHDPAETHFFPGFPLALSPFLIFFDPRNPWLKAVPMIFTGLSVVLMALLFRRRFRWRILGPAVGLYLLNPVTAMYATSFMSEPFFVLMVLATFCLLERTLRDDRPVNRWLLGGVLAWTMLTRPIGAIVWMSTALGLILSRRLKAFWISQGFALGIWSLFLFRNYVVSNSPNDYLRFWGSELSSLSIVSRLIENTWVVFQTIFTGHVLNLSRWVPAPSLWSAVITVFFAASWIVGWRRSYQRWPDYRGVWISIAAYVIFYLTVHGLWMTFDDRYALPLLPFLLPFTLLGLASFIPREELSPLWPVLIGLCFLPGLVAENTVSLKQTLSSSRPPHSLLPRATLRWIEENIPADELISTHSVARLYLWTRRKGIGQPIAHDREEARFLLLKAGMHYVLLQGGAPLSLSVETKANQAANSARFTAWVTHWPEVFELKYRNAEEGTAVYYLAPDAAYVQRYRAFLSRVQ